MNENMMQFLLGSVMECELPKRTEEGALVTIRHRGHTLSWSFERPIHTIFAENTQVEDRKIVKYREVLPGVTARYTIGGFELKEDIICESGVALESVALRLPNAYRYVVNEDQSMSVRDLESGAERFFFDIPVVYDATGMTVIGKVRLTPCDGHMRLDYQIEEDFLEVCEYPVTIDPIVMGVKEE